MDGTDFASPPRLARAVCLQVAALGAAVLVGDLPWSRRESRVAEPPPRETPRPEMQIRVVRLAPPPKAPSPVARKEPAPLQPAPAQRQPAPPQTQPAPAPPKPAPAQAQSAPPPQPQPAPHRQPPAPAKHALAKLDRAPTDAPRPAPDTQRRALEPRARIAADSTSLEGVRMRVLVPSSPGELASHLRNSGGCMVVSRLGGGDAEVLSVLNVQGQRAVERPGPPCNGVPRLLRDPALNDALGDPLGRVRAALPGSEQGDDLVLQVLLTERLHDLAQRALRAKFGPVAPEEMARRAADSGYELTCFAEPAGSLRCQ